MDRLDMALILIQEAKEEKALLEKYEKDNSKLPGYGEPGYQEAVDDFYRKWPKAPHKSVVNDNLKMARRILAGEYM